MRQAGGTVAGLEDHRFVFADLLQTVDQLARFLERPGAAVTGKGGEIRAIFGGGFGDFGHLKNSWFRSIRQARKL